MTSLLTKFTLEENKNILQELAFFRSMRVRLGEDRLMDEESRQRILGEIGEVQRKLVQRLTHK